jgi:Leucine-rich repeat (LRR) protein
MKYIPSESSNQKEELDKNSLAYIPFSYDLRGAEVSRNSSLLSPIKVEPRITNCLLDNNDLQEVGMLELSKVLIINEGIKYLSLNHSILKTRYLEYFSHLMGIYNNYTLEELHLSGNSLKENCEEYLPKLISHLKGLKTLNISFNNLKSGLASSFAVLRKL